MPGPGGRKGGPGNRTDVGPHCVAGTLKRFLFNPHPNPLTLWDGEVWILSRGRWAAFLSLLRRKRFRHIL